MAGLGKVLKEAQKMQKKMDQVQSDLAQRDITVTSGGGAVTITITGAQVIKTIKLDPDLLKEDVAMVEETLLLALQEAVTQAKQVSEAEMQKITSGFSLPGFGM